MCPPKCRNVTANAIAYVDVSGRAHRPSPTVYIHVGGHDCGFPGGRGGPPLQLRLTSKHRPSG